RAVRRGNDDVAGRGGVVDVQADGLHPGVRDELRGALDRPRLRSRGREGGAAGAASERNGVVAALTAFDDACKRRVLAEREGVVVARSAREVLEAGERDTADRTAAVAVDRPRAVSRGTDERVGARTAIHRDC